MEILLTPFFLNKMKVKKFSKKSIMIEYGRRAAPINRTCRNWLAIKQFKSQSIGDLGFTSPPFAFTFGDTTPRH